MQRSSDGFHLARNTRHGAGDVTRRQTTDTGARRRFPKLCRRHHHGEIDFQRRERPSATAPARFAPSRHQTSGAPQETPSEVPDSSSMPLLAVGKLYPALFGMRTNLEAFTTRTAHQTVTRRRPRTISARDAWPGIETPLPGVHATRERILRRGSPDRRAPNEEETSTRRASYRAVYHGEHEPGTRDAGPGVEIRYSVNPSSWVSARCGRRTKHATPTRKTPHRNVFSHDNHKLYTTMAGARHSARNRSGVGVKIGLAAPEPRSPRCTCRASRASPVATAAAPPAPRPSPAPSRTP